MALDNGVLEFILFYQEANKNLYKWDKSLITAVTKPVHPNIHNSSCK